MVIAGLYITSSKCKTMIIRAVKKWNLHQFLLQKGSSFCDVQYSWISTLLRDAASRWRPTELSCRFFSHVVSFSPSFARTILSKRETFGYEAGAKTPTRFQGLCPLFVCFMFCCSRVTKYWLERKKKTYLAFYRTLIILINPSASERFVYWLFSNCP